MNNPFKIGAVKTHQKVVKEDEVAKFESGQVHAFYSTFALTRDAEWAGRLFVLDMKEEDEEGIGTFVNVNHKSPAMVGDLVTITATLDEVKGNAVICSFEARVEDRLIADGTTGQKIIKKQKLEQLIRSING